ncbi:hypothetical protein SAMN00808754_1680 [Thermanaeromonas toyohensis ToBE]|uniref:Uncharacterized protein n=1 Tax=Thermanaeromonas toyohensis ToBE TaxID=698762 RepID=A0A1W1VU14_9FIRM|nr:hypothetical protein SAMN00808754_1680 [Thermanaeromonas toyohensis ToBE]
MEYRNAERCSACGGRCCAIYLPVEDGGMFPAGWYGFDEWAEGWFDYFEESGALNCGVQLLHDPLVLHMADHCQRPHG